MFGRWFTRNITKPLMKRFTSGSVYSNMEQGYRTSCNSIGIYLPVILVIVCMLVLLSIDTISSRNTIVFSIGSPGKEPVYLNGVYKMAYEKTDGSIDVVFNIPKGADELFKANITDSGIDPEVFNISLSANSKDTTIRSPVITPHIAQNLYPLTLDADYVINPIHLCSGRDRIDYIYLVHSATAYSSRRRFMRETFAAKKLFGNIEHRLLFLLGETNDPKTTRSINMEALTHGDVLQGAFVDSYHNLTHKGVMGFRWVTEHCPNVRLIVKIDDDVFMDPFQFVKNYLPLYSRKFRSIACHVRAKDTSVIERGKGKWQVKPDEFKGHTSFPFTYCNGYFVIMTPDLLRPLLLAARMNPFFWIDDVYLFGMLPATIGNVTFHNIRDQLKINFNSMKECYVKSGRNCTILAASQWKENEQITLWHSALSLLTLEERKSLLVFQSPQKDQKPETPQTPQITRIPQTTQKQKPQSPKIQNS